MLPAIVFLLTDGLSYAGISSHSRPAAPGSWVVTSNSA